MTEQKAVVLGGEEKGVLSKYKLELVPNVNREGKEIKSVEGIKSYVRDDAQALYLFSEAINSKLLSVRERAVAVSIADKCRDAFLTFSDALELTSEEVVLFKKLLSNEDKEVVYPMFVMRTMQGFLEQLGGAGEQTKK